MAHMLEGAKNVVINGGIFVAKTVQQATYWTGTLNVNFFPRITNENRTDTTPEIQPANNQPANNQPANNRTDAPPSSSLPPLPYRKREVTKQVAAIAIGATAVLWVLNSRHTTSSSQSVPFLPPAIEIYGRHEVVRDAVQKILAPFNSKSEVKKHITIKGGPGIGKTTTAIGILYHPDIIQHFGNARHWVSCREASNIEDGMKAQKLLEFISNSLGLDLTASNDRRKDIKYFFETSDIPRIIVLDNFETMWEPHGAQQAVEDVLKFLAQFTQLTIILTTRNAHNPVIHLGVPWHQFDSIQPLSLSASRELFTSLSPPGSIDNSLDDLLRAVDCVPLAIILMASSAQENYTTSRILEIWNKGLVSPGPHAFPLVANDGNPMNVLDRSIEMSLVGPLIKAYPETIILLRIIAGLPGGIRHENVRQIAPIQDVDRVTGVLVRTSLINNLPDGLQMHSTVRSYMLRNYAVSAEHKRMVRDFYFQLIHEAGDEPGTREFLSRARRLSDEQINAETILSDALDNDLKESIWIAMDYCNYLAWNTPSTDIAKRAVKLLKIELQSRGEDPGISPTAAILSRTETCVAIEGSTCQLSPMPDFIYPLALLHLGALHFRLDHYPEAIEALEEAVIRCQAPEQQHWASQAEIHLAGIYRLRGNYTRSLQLYSNAYNRSESDTRSRVAAQRGMAIIHFENNSLSDALRVSEEAKNACLANDHSCMADSERELGRIYRRHNQTESIRLSSSARDYYLAHGPLRNAAIALYQKSIALYMKGDYDNAEAGFNTAFEEFKLSRNDAQMAYCVFHLADMNSMRGTLPKALALFSRAEKMFNHIENKFMAGLALKGQGEIQARMCRTKEAKKAYDDAHALLGNGNFDANEAATTVMVVGAIEGACEFKYDTVKLSTILAIVLLILLIFIRKLGH